MAGQCLLTVEPPLCPHHCGEDTDPLGFVPGQLVVTGAPPTPRTTPCPPVQMVKVTSKHRSRPQALSPPARSLTWASGLTKAPINAAQVGLTAWPWGYGAAVSEVKSDWGRRGARGSCPAHLPKGVAGSLPSLVTPCSPSLSPACSLGPVLQVALTLLPTVPSGAVSRVSRGTWAPSKLQLSDPPGHGPCAAPGTHAPCLCLAGNRETPTSPRHTGT